MGYDDHRRFPDVTQIDGFHDDYTGTIDAVLVTHFHLDHCGALPYFTENHGYHGPIIMSSPTRAIVPLMLEDFRKVAVDHRGESGMFTTNDITTCMNKVSTVELH